MIVTTLIAAYREDPHQLERVIDDALQIGPVVVLADSGDYSQQLLSIVARHGVRFEVGSYRNERDKRNALLGYALDQGLDRNDWLLTIDPDEKLLNPDALRLQLDRTPANQLFYPLLRVEPHGGLWEMPSRLFRAAKPAYTYLDIGIKFGSGNWNLDPWHVGRRPVTPGWPVVAHYGSPRAASDPSGFYTEDNPLPHFDFTYQEWRTTHEHPGGYAN